MISIGLVDDHITTRAGLKTLIEHHSRIKVTLEASSGKELLSKLANLSIHPQILILDLNMPEMNGLETLNAVKNAYPSMKIIVFSMFTEEDMIINMITHGANGFLAKNSDPSKLEEAILMVSSVGYYVGELSKKEYFNNSNKSKTKSGFTGKAFLNDKELEFMKLSASNLTLKQMAETMKVSPKTIENYRDSLFHKLGINNRSSLVIYGIKNGIIPVFTKVG